MMLRKYVAFVLLSFGGVMLASFTIKEQPLTAQELPAQKSRLKKIVIDAGHGGADGGADGRYSNEKTIALAISLKLEEMMREQMPDIELVMTRRSDIYQHPTVKASIANHAKADLFVCIHCNSANGIRHSEFIGYKTVTVGKGKKKRKVQQKQYRYYTTPNPAKGTETYIWGAHKNDDKEIAMRENQALFFDSLTAKSSDYEMNPIEINLRTRQYFDRSVTLAQTIEDEFAKSGRISREARQRQVGIWVLQAVAMPAVLVETGYISNPEEEEYLNSKDGQAEVAQAIINAIKRYRYALDNKGITATPANGK